MKASTTARRPVDSSSAQGPSLLREMDWPHDRGAAPILRHRPPPTAPGTVFSPQVFVHRLELESGPCRDLDLPCAPVVAQRWRAALLTQLQELPERLRPVLSGHEPNGRPLDEPHLSFLPLASVGRPRANGQLVGMGLVLPGGLAAEDRRLLVGTAARVERLMLGRLGVWRVVADAGENLPPALRPGDWTAYPTGAMQWSTVTPIAFDRHSKSSESPPGRGESGSMIAEACVRIGLPAPREVIVTAASAHLGVPPAHAFPRLARKDGSQRRHAHAVVVFHRPVCGPMALGAGRYRGYGVCRPLNGAGPA